MGPQKIERGIDHRLYFTDPMHRFLAEDAWREEGPNIGRDGEHLTIAFLSLERVNLSIRLVRSIAAQLPTFAGEILVVDNGSGERSLDALKTELDRLPMRSRVVCLGRNSGVAGGRNRGMESADSDWVMWLDNDIYFVGNPLQRIQRDIAELGCHFINLPLLQPDGRTIFAKGGHLHTGLANGYLYLSGRSVYQQRPIGDLDGPSLLSTFLYGGACVVKAQSFRQAGGYDETALIGFEDTDFSLRLFRAGMKVGTTGAVALIHDHPPPTGESDEDYEAQRFNDEILLASARHFEQKHGFRFWTRGTSQWLDSRRAELGLPALGAAASSEERDHGRPKIALIVNANEGAFFNIASELILLLGDRFAFSLVSMETIEHDVPKALLISADCQLVHFFARDVLAELEGDRSRRDAAALGYDLPAFKRRYLHSKAITTAVFDHLHLAPEAMRKTASIFTQLSTSYAVCSNRLDAIYQSIPGYPKPAAVLPEGVDLRLFQPQRLGRLSQRPGDRLVVGWAGDSGKGGEGEDPAGLETILLPALRSLADAKHPISWRFADRATQQISFSDMPDYYASIDVLVCSSASEGTGRSVIEAMACGIPVISTDVGIVRDALGPQQQAFILSERTPAAMRQAILSILEDRGRLPVLSAENLDAVKAWDWPLLARDYERFFRDALSRFGAKKAHGSEA